MPDDSALRIGVYFIVILKDWFYFLLAQIVKTDLSQHSIASSLLVFGFFLLEFQLVEFLKFCNIFLFILLKLKKVYFLVHTRQLVHLELFHLSIFRILDFEFIDPDENKIELLSHLLCHSLLFVILIQFSLYFYKSFQSISGF